MSKLSKINQIFEKLLEEFPNPNTELDYKNEFTLLVSVILSAQTTDKIVNRATKYLFEKVSTPEEMLKLGEEGLKNYIKIIGLYNSKAKNIMSMCKMLIEEHNSQVPNKLEDLIKLPGVGRKTANVVLNTAFGERVIAVDTHVHRLSNRIGLVKTTLVNKTEENLMKIIPKNFLKDAHHLLILHGRYICKARNPECSICKIKDFCEYYANFK